MVSDLQKNMKSRDEDKLVVILHAGSSMQYMNLASRIASPCRLAFKCLLTIIFRINSASA